MESLQFITCNITLQLSSVCLNDLNRTSNMHMSDNRRLNKLIHREQVTVADFHLQPRREHYLIM